MTTISIWAVIATIIGTMAVCIWWLNRTVNPKLDLTPAQQAIVDEADEAWRSLQEIKGAAAKAQTEGVSPDIVVRLQEAENNARAKWIPLHHAANAVKDGANFEGDDYEELLKKYEGDSE